MSNNKVRFYGIIRFYYQEKKCDCTQKHKKKNEIPIFKIQ